MKKILLLIFVSFSLQGFSQGKPIIEQPKVDKRVELLSFTFRYAGNQEYSSDVFKSYVEKIEQHFEPYKNHELIHFAKKMREEKGISFDAPMSLAISLDENLNPLNPFTENSFGRWCKEDANEFVTLLKKYYNDSKCDVFFKNNQTLYQEIEDRFSPVYKNLDLNWFRDFYGKEASDKFIIAIGLGNGVNCYGPSYTSQDKKKEVYAIIGVWETDSLGKPQFNIDDYLPVIIHEFNHSFVNPLLEQNKAFFKTSGEQIFEALKYEMGVQQAYANWGTVLNEALVRASVIKYFKDHHAGQSYIDGMFNEELKNGFLWIKELVAELENYDTDRSTYPTLESYMPKLAEAYKAYAEKVVQFDAKRPMVESIKEFENGSTNVDATIKTITVLFDRPLSGKGYSIYTGEKGKQAFPKIHKIYYTDGNKSVIMEVEVEADKEYQFVLNGKNFNTPDGFPLKTYEVSFKTAR